MSRVWTDIDACIAFVAQQPWGDPAAREREIHRAFEQIRVAPLSRPISGNVPGTGIELRCYNLRQFVIVYAYFPSNEACPHDLVIIRAVRHRRERDVLWGVREPGLQEPTPSLQTRDASREAPRVGGLPSSPHQT
jgi:hypothetical protein